MNNLTPKLTESQLKENIDALQKQGKDNVFVQSYVDNYKKDANGTYSLKTAGPFLEKGTYGNEPQGTAAYLPEEAANAASGIGKGIISTAQDSSNLINKIASFIPQSLHEPIKKYALSNPMLAPLATALGVVSKISPTISKLETSVGAEPGALTTANNPTEKVGKFTGQAAMAAFPAEGAVSGLIEGSGKYLAKQAFEKAPQIALDAIVPTAKELTASEFESALKESGRVVPKTLTKPATIIATPEEKRLADVYSHLLQSGDPVKNADNVISAISQRDTEVGQFLSKNPKPFDKGELIDNLLKKVEPITDVMVPNEANLQKAKDGLILKLVDSIKGDTLYDLWKGRKDFDAVIESRLNAFGGSPTLKKEIAREVRNGTQEFITEQLGSDVYKNKMSEMSDLFRVAEKIADKAAKEKNLSIIQNWIKKNPTKAKVIGWTAGLIGAKGGYDVLTR